MGEKIRQCDYLNSYKVFSQQVFIPIDNQSYDSALPPSFGGPQSSINGQVIRFADVLLMLAESYIQRGDFGRKPLGLINRVRQRVGAVNYFNLGGSQTGAIDILRRETQLELCGEQSRYFDLIRCGIAKQTINGLKLVEPKDGTQPFQDKHMLFPIPNVKKDFNTNVAKVIQMIGISNHYYYTCRIGTARFLLNR